LGYISLPFTYLTELYFPHVPPPPWRGRMVGGLRLTIQCPQDHLFDGFDVLRDIMIPESQDVKSLRYQPRIPL
jgi:hypothetical protein